MNERTGGADDLLGQALRRENMGRAWKRVETSGNFWKRVKANKGNAGVDGRTVLRSGEHLKTEWPDIRASLQTAATGPSRCAACAYPNRLAGRASSGYRRWWTD